MRESIELEDAEASKKYGKPARCTPAGCALYSLFGGRVCRFTDPPEERSYDSACEFNLTQIEAHDISLLHPEPQEKVEVKKPPRFGFLKD